MKLPENLSSFKEAKAIYLFDGKDGGQFNRKNTENRNKFYAELAPCDLVLPLFDSGAELPKTIPTNAEAYGVETTAYIHNSGNRYVNVFVAVDDYSSLGEAYRIAMAEIGNRVKDAICDFYKPTYLVKRRKGAPSLKIHNSEEGRVLIGFCSDSKILQPGLKNKK